MDLTDYEKQELRDAWSAVYLDGRNEHGTHVLPLPQGTVYEDDVSNRLPEYAETIMAAAEKAGHEAWDCVVVTWRWVDHYDDEPGHYELSGSYHADLTAAFFGTPYEQKQERARAASKLER